ncbi:hypothetical protein C8R45DRAFT_1207018 [Mycena sanguinolenta]|nr:hypothetical protein C8R45DRAFT_1207018 [Mycena sanguinolenta]
MSNALNSLESSLGLEPTITINPNLFTVTPVPDPSTNSLSNSVIGVIVVVAVGVLAVVGGGFARLLRARRAKAALLTNAEKEGVVSVNARNANVQAGVPAETTTKTTA